MLVQADLGLGGLEALLDAPADARDPHEMGEGGRFRGPAAVEGQLTGGDGAADQQAVPAAVVGVSGPRSCPGWCNARVPCRVATEAGSADPPEVDSRSDSYRARLAIASLSSRYIIFPRLMGAIRRS